MFAAMKSLLRARFCDANDEEQHEPFARPADVSVHYNPLSSCGPGTDTIKGHLIGIRCVLNNDGSIITHYAI
jgi:hypothetical protein